MEAKRSARSPCEAQPLKKRACAEVVKIGQGTHRLVKEKWRNILWTDGSKIALFGSSGHRQYIRRPPVLNP